MCTCTLRVLDLSSSLFAGHHLLKGQAIGSTRVQVHRWHLSLTGVLLGSDVSLSFFLAFSLSHLGCSIDPRRTSLDSNSGSQGPALLRSSTTTWNSATLPALSSQSHVSGASWTRRLVARDVPDGGFD